MKFLVVLIGAALMGAVGLFGWGARAYHAETRPMLPAEVEEPERDVGERPVGTSQVVFRITNPTDHPIEVVGGLSGCGTLCCLKATVAERQTIPPGGALDLACELSVAAAAPFEYRNKIYLNDNGLQAIKIVVRGVGVAPGAGNVPKP